METLIHAGLMNAVFVTILAVVVAGVAVFFRRRPAVIHALWILVLVKFLVPSFYSVEIPGWRPPAAPVVTPEPIVIQEHPSPAHLEEQIPSPPEDTSSDPIDGDHPPAAMMEPAVVESSETAISNPTTPSKPSAWQFSWEHVVAIVWLAGSLAWMMVAWIRI